MQLPLLYWSFLNVRPNKGDDIFIGGSLTYRICFLRASLISFDTAIISSTFMQLHVLYIGRSLLPLNPFCFSPECFLSSCLSRSHFNRCRYWLNTPSVIVTQHMTTFNMIIPCKALHCPWVLLIFVSFKVKFSFQPLLCDDILGASNYGASTKANELLAPFWSVISISSAYLVCRWSVGHSRFQISTLSVSLYPHRVLVNHGMSYSFWKVWPFHLTKNTYLPTHKPTYLHTLENTV